MANVGDVLRGQRGEYTLNAFLGEGLTSRVFRARASYLENEVAVKVLKPGLGQEVVERFQNEGLLMAEVAAGLRAWEADQLPGPARLPTHYETVLPPVSFDGEAFLVLDLIPGHKVEDLLVLEGPFAEEAGLLIGVQLFGLLQVLHEQVKRTYTDFKFENLWWISTEQRLWVTDWNVLSKPADLDGAPRDLERGARALVTILTGQPLPPGRALSQHPGWKSLSEGAKQVLSLLLHPMPERRRPTRAAAVRQDLGWLLQAWQGDVQRLLDHADDMLPADEELGPESAAESAGRQRLERANAVLSVLYARYERDQGRNLEASWPAQRIHQLDDLRARTTRHVATPERSIGAARQMLEAGSAGAACDLLEQALIEMPDDLSAHRLLSAARSIAGGHARAKAEQAVLLAAIAYCGQGNFADAQASLKTLPNETVASGLRCEIAGSLQWERAQQAASAEEAWRAGSEAHKQFLQLDDAYRDAVISSLQVNFSERLAELEQQASLVKRKREALALAAQMEEQQDLAKAVEKARQDLPPYADQPRVVTAALDLARRCMEHRKPDLARRVYATGARLARRSEFDWEETVVLPDDKAPLFRAGWRVAAALDLLQRAPLADTTYQALNKVVQELSSALGNAQIDERKYYEALKQSLVSALADATNSIRAPDETMRPAVARLSKLEDDVRYGAQRSLRDQVRSVLQSAWQEDKQAIRPVIDDVMGLPSGLLLMVEHLFQQCTADQRRDVAEAKNDSDRKTAIGVVLGFDALTQALAQTMERASLLDHQKQQLRGLLLSRFGLSEKTLSALERMPEKQRAVIEQSMPAADLPAALARSLEPKVLLSVLAAVGPGQFREETLTLVKTQWDLSPAAYSVLSHLLQTGGDRLQQAKSEDDARRLIAQALGLPQNIKLLDALAGDAPDKQKLARELSQLANRISPESHQQPGELPSTGTERSQEGKAHHPSANTRQTMTAATPAASTGADGKPSPAAILNLLNSNRPQDWDMGVQQATLANNLPSTTVQKVEERRNQLANHRRAMDRVFRYYDTTPSHALNEFNTWRSGGEALPEAWNPRKQQWQAIDALRQDLERAAATMRVRQSIDIAGQQKRAGQTDLAKQALNEALRQSQADKAVLDEARRDLAQLQPTHRSTPAEQPSTLAKLLERPLAESETLIDLRQRIQGLMGTATIYVKTLQEQYQSLENWIDRERWLGEVEGKPSVLYSEGDADSANSYLTFLNELLAKPCWQPYATTETPVFKRLRSRLEKIARKVRVTQSA